MTYNFSLAKPPEGEPDQCTKEAAAKRQDKIDRDVAEFLRRGGEVTSGKSNSCRYLPT